MLCLPGVLLATVYLSVLRQSKQGVGTWGLAPAGRAVLLDTDKSVNRPCQALLSPSLPLWEHVFSVTSEGSKAKVRK